MPNPDIPTPDNPGFGRRKTGFNARPGKHLFALLAALLKTRRRRGGSSLLPETVNPYRPNTLSGGAAVELEFDD